MCIQATIVTWEKFHLYNFENFLLSHSNRIHIRNVSSNSEQIKIATCMLLQKQSRGSRQSGLLLIWHQDTHVPKAVWELNEKGKKRASDAFTISGTWHNRNLMQNCVKGCNLYHTWKALYTSPLSTSLSEEKMQAIFALHSSRHCPLQHIWRHISWHPQKPNVQAQGILHLGLSLPDNTVSVLLKGCKAQKASVLVLLLYTSQFWDKQQEFYLDSTLSNIAHPRCLTLITVNWEDTKTCQTFLWVSLFSTLPWMSKQYEI